MGNKIQNATQMPKRYFGLHMSPGVAEYQPKDGDPFRIFVSEETIKDMNPTFEGKPVVVGHLEQDFKPEDLDNVDGLVVKSFYNEADGKNWVEFMVSSDAGHKAIQQGWKLSNAYFQRAYGPGGICQGVSYDKEIKKGEYEHLAIVKNPRYSDSVIFTPEQFAEYNEKKREEIKKLSNSKEKEENKKKETPSMFKIFKREKLENAADLENSMVELPTCKKEMSISDALKIADKFLNMNGYANGDHFVKADDEEMSVNDMAKKYSEMKNKMKNMIDKPKEEEKPENEDDKDKEKKENGDETDKAGKDDLDKEAKDEKAKNASDEDHFEKLKNAADKTKAAKPVPQKLMHDKLRRGQANY